ncbi:MULTISPECIES: hypothetical protein [unclassified Legionella]|uniref:baeRF3 domain-containing protein n=1 Tax=unclassified Legionella TaxID=2622702 RepID=UPI0010547C8F|nr:MULTISPECIES: hypothetical protein [unclassified Legionella]MDI9818699.1 hypothetical protein [Legionella sp. PL877]
MDLLTHDNLMKLINYNEPPCLSLYQPTHRSHPNNQQDSIRFKNLIKVMEDSLKQYYSKSKARDILQPFYELANDFTFWEHNDQGLAVLGAGDFFQIYRLPRPVPELAIVADDFHIKPLIRIVQSADRYHILGLNRHEVKLFEGNRDSLREIELDADIPLTIVDALGDELTTPHQTVGSYGHGPSGPAMYHGHGGKKEEVDSDASRFFKIIDSKILNYYSRPSGLPLLLAALPEHHHLFHSISRNPFLIEKSLDIHPDAVPVNTLREKAWELMRTNYLNKLNKLIEKYNQAKARKLGSDNLSELGKAVFDGRISALLIAAETQVGGRLDRGTGDIQSDDLQNPGVNDLLDDLAELTLKTGGEVVVVPSASMPTETGAAGIFRF